MAVALRRGRPLLYPPVPCDPPVRLRDRAAATGAAETRSWAAFTHQGR